MMISNNQITLGRTSSRAALGNVITKKTRNRIIHNAILIILFLWLALVFFTLKQDGSERKISYYKWIIGGDEVEEMRSIVLKRHHHSRVHPLNLLKGMIPNPQMITGSRSSKNGTVVDESKAEKPNLTCDLSHFRTDVCYIKGDVRVEKNKVMLVRQNSGVSRRQDIVVAKVKPYTRKWEKSCMDTIGEVSVEEATFPSTDHQDHEHRKMSRSSRNTCTVNHSVPVIIFSTGGYTGNVYHEFNDGLIPLFITAEEFKGEVVFMILELHDWWMMKYGSIVESLSKYPVLDFDHSKEMHCFPKAIVGLKIHSELDINSTLMEDGKSMRDFQALIKASFQNDHISMPPQLLPQERKRKLVLITRKSSRVLLNQNAVLKLASKMGFDIRTLSPNSHTELSEVHRVLQEADVLVGVHGAALTHFLFMRPGSVFIQVIPLGTEWPAFTYYGEPAIKAGLQYIEYKISPEESSLMEKYGRNHTAVTHPERIAAQGWWEVKKIYLQAQNVKLSLSRFRPILEKALQHIKQQDHSSI